MGLGTRAQLYSRVMIGITRKLAIRIGCSILKVGAVHQGQHWPSEEYAWFNSHSVWAVFAVKHGLGLLANCLPSGNRVVLVTTVLHNDHEELGNFK